MALKKVISEVSSAIYSLPWYVARDEGFFAEVGLEVEFVKARGGTPRNGLADTRLVAPIIGHVPFAEGEVKLFRACEEGNVRRAFDLSASKVEGCDVQITSLQPSRPLHALVAAPGSGIDRPAQLIGRNIAVNFFAGSHFAAIRLLEGFAGKGRFNLLHFGGPAERLAAVLRGEVDAGIIMEPYVTLAEKLGAHVLAQGFFVATDVAREDFSADDLRKLYAALDRAADFLNASADHKRKYLHYLIDEIPVDYPWGKPDVADFHLPRLRFGHTDPYPKAEFDRSVQILRDYDLLEPSSTSHFDRVVNNSPVVGAVA
jgi:NitT/TauT family transport system substrate-binding protein